MTDESKAKLNSFLKKIFFQSLKETLPLDVSFKDPEQVLIGNTENNNILGLSFI